jgi:hypothetical protein|tara:strand:- start:458 stop:682 length:225 start_codon:yes stop_codon:yes gene_type:complete
MNKDLFNQDIKVIHNCVDSLMKSLSELNTVYKSMEQDPNLNGRKDVAISMSKIIDTVMEFYHFDRYLQIEMMSE